MKARNKTFGPCLAALEIVVPGYPGFRRSRAKTARERLHHRPTLVACLRHSTPTNGVRLGQAETKQKWAARDYTGLSILSGVI